jgi:citronellol/citronellal dehydrogenase
MAYHSVFAPRLCAGQTVLVTGGGSGIGRCTARELAALGASVALVGREAEKLAAVQQEIEAADGRCSTHVSTSGRTEPFDGFHVASTPRVLSGGDERATDNE